MKHDERIEIIIREVQEKGQVKVPELAQMLDCSEVTIRNDIRKLDDQGILKKTHGGAEKRSYGLSVQFESGEYYLNADYKRRIAEKAYEYIEDQESIMIDDSTTCCYLAQIIKERKEKRLILSIMLYTFFSYTLVSMQLSAEAFHNSAAFLL